VQNLDFPCCVLVCVLQQCGVDWLWLGRGLFLEGLGDALKVAWYVGQVEERVRVTDLLLMD
jgi:hypothetical protein